jgi:hypothetical protein
MEQIRARLRRAQLEYASWPASFQGQSMRSSNIMPRMHSLLACLLCFISSLLTQTEIVALPSCNNGITQTSVSGLSSDTFTATLKETKPEFYVIDHLTCP